MGDASDTDLIASVCARALDEHGRLDFFFANAGTTGANMTLDGLDEEGVMQVMKVNVLRCVLDLEQSARDAAFSKAALLGLVFAVESALIFQASATAALLPSSTRRQR